MSQPAAFVVSVMLLCRLALAQEPGSISGTVTDPNGEALPGVLVAAATAVSTQAWTTTTAASGDYRLLLPPGDYVVTCSLDGFVREERAAQVQPQQDAVLDLVMQLSYVEEVVVTARKTPENLQTVPIAVTALRREDIARSGAYNVVELYKYSPNTTLWELLNDVVHDAPRVGRSGPPSSPSY